MKKSLSLLREFHELVGKMQSATLSRQEVQRLRELRTALKSRAKDDRRKAKATSATNKNLQKASKDSLQELRKKSPTHKQTEPFRISRLKMHPHESAEMPESKGVAPEEGISVPFEELSSLECVSVVRDIKNLEFTRRLRGLNEEEEKRYRFSLNHLFSLVLYDSSPSMEEIPFSATFFSKDQSEFLSNEEQMEPSFPFLDATKKTLDANKTSYLPVLSPSSVNDFLSHEEDLSSTNKE